MGISDALVVGLAQGIAIVPGISRSGSTIVAGLLVGLDRELAARYSFLLSVPAIGGAALLKLHDGAGGTPVAVLPTVLGCVAAGLVGFGALKALIPLVARGRLYIFAPYVLLVAGIGLVLLP